MRVRLLALLCGLTILLILSAKSLNMAVSYSGTSNMKIPAQAVNQSDYIWHPGVRISSDNVFQAQGWPGNGTEENPYVIEGLNITGLGVHAVVISNTTAHFVIRNSYLIAQGQFADCIRLEDVNNAKIENCIISHGQYGIFLSQSNHISISNCSILGAGSIGVTLYYSHNVTIANNLVYGAVRGIRYENSEDGIVIGNTVYRNSGAGIVMYRWTFNNMIYNNRIGYNGPEGFEDPAYSSADHGDGNFWDNGVDTGNMWWGYNTTTPYPIGGVSGVVDRYPSGFEDVMAPTVNSPSDIEYEEENGAGYNVTWSPNDAHLWWVNIFLNGEYTYSGIWDYMNLTVNVGHHTYGAYNYTIQIVDAAGNVVSDTVYIRVLAYMLGGIGTELVIYSSALSVAIFIFFVVLLKKLR